MHMKQFQLSCGLWRKIRFPR